MGDRNKLGDLVQGTLDMLILKTLGGRRMHGYAVAEFIHETSEDVLHVEEGALYPALYRLELRGLLASEWGISENNRRAKFYRLTAAASPLGPAPTTIRSYIAFSSIPAFRPKHSAASELLGFRRTSSPRQISTGICVARIPN
jgi:PadR family transcriptional regulator, regulatory protein PadR